MLLYLVSLFVCDRTDVQSWGGAVQYVKTESMSGITAQRPQLTAFPLLNFDILFSESHSASEITKIT